MGNAKEIIAKRAAKELHDGDVVNLGIGLPTMVTSYLDPSVTVIVQSENGYTGMGPKIEGKESWDIIDAGGWPASIKDGGAFFNSATSFGIIRGGHVDASILGGLEVDEEGSIANWIVPGKSIPGMGGAMDLVVGAKNVIVTMEHMSTNKKTGEKKPKILKKCTLPLTALKQVNMIITEMGVMRVTDKGLVLEEYNPEYTLEEIQAATEAKLIINNPKKMDI